MTDFDTQHSNISEEEMGQIHSMHFSMNGIESVRNRLPTGPGTKDCVDCDNEIPYARRVAMRGCIRCIHCQDIFEKE